MAIGQVKWFNNQKGYGFLETAESTQDVFVHFSDIQMEGYKTLKEKSWVYFVLEERDRGPNARQVSPLLTESVEHEGVTVGAPVEVREVPDIVAVHVEAEPIVEQYEPAFDEDDDVHMPSHRYNKRQRHAKTERASMV